MVCKIIRVTQAVSHVVRGLVKRFYYLSTYIMVNILGKLEDEAWGREKLGVGSQPGNNCVKCLY